MRTATAALADVITGGSFRMTLVGDVLRGSRRLLTDLQFSTWGFHSDYDADIKSGGNVTALYAGDFAETVTPHDLSDALSPYGSELHCYIDVSAESFQQRIPYGKFRIDGVPAAIDAYIKHNDRDLVIGSAVDLRLLDRFETIKAAQFRSLAAPASLTSAWAELARVSRMQITRTVADQVIPASIVYPRSRLETVQILAKVLGGRPYATATGTLGVIPDTAGSVVASLTVGPDGSVGTMDYAMEAENNYNVVVGDFETDDGQPIHVEAELTTGPLAIDQWGEHVLIYDRPDKNLIRNVTAAQAAVNAELARVSTDRTYELPLQVTPNPLLEIGDVITVTRQSRMMTGRIKTIALNGTGPMTLKIAVLSDVAI